MKRTFTFLSMIACCLLIGSGFLASSVYGQSPVTASPDAVAISDGAHVSNPNNAFTSNNAYAEFTTAAAGWATYHTFNPGIPLTYDVSTPTTIIGIEVLLEGYAVTGTYTVHLSKDAGGSLSSISLPANLPGTEGIVTVGSSTQLWGETWTAAEVNDADFSVRITSDATGNQAFLDHIQVRVYYSIPPAITVTNLVRNNDTGVCTALIDLTDAVTITAGYPTPTLSFLMGTTPIPASYSFESDLLVYNITVAATNAYGTAGTNFTVRVNDTEAPEITTCPVPLSFTGCSTADISGVPVFSTSLTTSSYAVFSDATNEGVADDNCIGSYTPTVTYQDVIANASCPIIVSRTWTVTDEFGLFDTCEQVITINAPAVMMTPPDPATITQCTTEGAVNTAFAIWLAEFSSSGGCGLTVTTEPASPTAPSFCGGSITVTWTGTSSCEDPVVVSSTFTVVPDVAPEFFAREDASTDRIPWVTPNIELPRPSTSCGVEVNWPTPYVEDDCLPDLATPTRTITPSPVSTVNRDYYRTSASFNPGTYTVTYTYTDRCSNTISRSFTITITDPYDPTFTGATPDYAINTDSNKCTATVTNWAQPSASHQCGVTMKTVIILADDTVIDDYASNTFDGFQVGVNTVNFVATANISGNVATRTFTVTVTDNEPPVVICPTPDNPYEVATGTCSITLTLTATATDNCTVATIEYSYAGGAYVLTDTYTYPVGTTAVIVLVTDVNGVTNTCSFDVEVEDTTPPEVLVVAGPLVRDLPATAPVEVAITIGEIDNGSNDPCGIAAMSLSKDLFTCADVGDNEVILTVTDTYGNVSSESVTVTIRDVTPPTVSCPADIAANADPGVCTASVTFTATASDNCGTPDIQYYIGGLGGTEISSPYAFPVGTTVVTVLATDVNTLTNTCTFEVVVTDNQQPTFTCPVPLASYPADAGQCYARLDITDFPVTDAADNCGAPTVQYRVGGTPISFPFNFPVGTTTVQVLVTDVNTLTSTCSFDVVVADMQDPFVACPGPQVRDANPGTCDKDVTVVFAEPTDNCGVATYTATASDPSVELSISAVSGSPGNVQIQGTFPLGTTSVTLTVTDVHSRVYSCTFTVQVNFVPIDPSQLPVANTQNITRELDASGSVSITPAEIYVPTATPIGCAFESYSVEPSTFGCNDVGGNTVTLTVNLKDGSSYTGTAIVTIENNQVPAITPKNFIVELGATGTATITADDVIDDIVHNCPIATETLDRYTFDCNDIANNPIVVNITVTDSNGVTATATAEVTVQDNLPPTLVADNITVELDADGQASLTPMQVYNAGASSDNCGISTPTLTLSKESFDCGDIGSVSVTLFGEDVNGNPASTTFTVTVEDNIAPEILCVGTQTVTTTVYDCTYVHSGTEWDATVTDNCNIASPTFELTGATTLTGGTSLHGVVFNLGTTYVTWSVTDAGGNPASCTFAVVVEDKTAPVLACPANITLTSNEDDCDLNVYWPRPVPTDNCGAVSLTVSTNPPLVLPIQTTWNGSIFQDNGEFPVGVTVVTYTATDTAGNVSTCSFTVTIHAFDLPVAKAKDITIYLSASGEVSIVPSDVNDGSWIDCKGSADIANYLSLDKTDFNCDDVGVNTVTLTVTDKTGRTATATAVVTVVDDIPPTVITQDLIVYLDADGNGSVTPQEVDNGSFDNCAIVTTTMALDQSAFTCADLGEVVVELTVYDIHGLSATATATITVIDNLPPVITCVTALGDPRVGTATNSCTYTHEGTAWDATATDNCGAYTLTYSLAGATSEVMAPYHSLDGQVFQVGVTTVTWHATDGTNAATNCTFVVTVIDDVAPVITLPTIAAKYLTDPNVCTASLTFVATATDNCDPDPVVTYYIGSSPVTFPYIFAKGATVVTVRATDNAGQYSEESFTVNVVDEQPPVFVNCPATTVIDTAGAGVCSDNVYWAPISAYDNCPAPGTPVSVTASFVHATEGPYSGGYSIDANLDHYKLLKVGTTTVTYTAIDGDGNRNTCVFIVLLHAEEGPQARAKNILVDLDSDGDASITPADVNNGSTIGCLGTGNINNYLSIDIDTFDCDDVGTNTVTLTVTDKSGRTSTAIALVTVRDLVAPVVTVTPTVVQLDANGEATITYADVASATDACGIQTETIDIDSFTCVDVGVNTITVTVTDVNGNVTIETVIVTVEDKIAPALTLNDLTVYLDDNGIATITFDQVASATDACGVVTKTLSRDEFDCDDVNGVVLVEVKAWDANGNLAVGTVSITVIDNIPPVITCPELAEFYPTDPGQCYATLKLEDVEASATDNCGIASIVYTVGGMEISFPYAFPKGTTTVTATATDVNGLTHSCTFDIVVRDTEAPVVDGACPGNLSGSVEDCGSKYFAWTAPSFTDNCDGAISFTQRPIQYSFYTSRASVDIQTSTHPAHGATFPVGITTVYYVATDEAGNATTCSFTVTVHDQEPPVARAKDQITVQLDIDGLASITPADVNDGSSDDCGILYMKVEPNSFVCADVGTLTVVLTVYDRTLRTSTATTVVTVEDKVAPVVTVTPTTVQLDANGVATITYSDVASATDACGIQTETINIDTFGCDDVGEKTVTVTVTDVNGNVTIETVIVTVEDKIAPALTLNDLTVYLDASGIATITFADVASSWDACGVITETLSREEFGCSDVGVVLVDVHAWDKYGNEAVGTVSITVIDNIWPTIACKTATDTFAYADLGVCTYTVTADEFNPASVWDNCPDYVVTHDYAAPSSHTLAGAVFPVGDTDVVWTVTDASGHQASCTITVRIRDNQLPSFLAGTFPASSTHDVASIGNCDLLVSWNNPVPTDNCGVETMTLSWVSNNSSTTSLNIEPDGAGKTRATFPAGVTTMTYTVLDIHGNSYSRYFTVTIKDKDKPTAIAKDIDVFLDEDGLATIKAADVDNGSSDVCGDVILSVYPSAFDCTQADTDVVVTLTVTDLSGNVTTATATVSVYDKIFPTIACVTDTYRVNDKGDCSYIVQGGEFDPVAWDNCPNFVVTHDYLPAPLNTTLADAIFPVGSTTVIWTVVDASGNTASCTIVVVVEDTEVPTIAAVADQNKNTDPEVCDYTVQGGEFDPETFGDNCPGAFIQHDYALAPLTNTLANAVFLKGSTVVVWTVTDAVGLSTTTMFTVTVTDIELPTIACATDTFRYNTKPVGEDLVGLCGYIVLGTEFDPTVDDNCRVDTVTNTYNDSDSLADEFFPVGDTVVTWYVTDTSGNVNSCTMTIEIRDNEEPVFVSFPADKQLGSSSAQNCEADWVWDVPVADDNCGVVTSSLKRWWTSTNPTANITWKDYNTVPPQTEATFPVGVTTVYYSIEDINGNVHTRSFTVTVDDNAKPTIVSCPEDRDIEGCTVADIDNPPFSDVMTLSDYDTFSGFDNLGEAYDNCGEIAQVWYQDVIINPTCEIVVERTWYIVDFSFNTVSCTQTIRINEDEAPTLALAGTLPGGHVGDDVCIDSRPPAPAAVDIAALYTDNCTVTLTATYDGETLAGTDCGWIVTYTYSVEDECENVTIAEVVYWGGDKQAPALVSNTLTCASLNISDVVECLEAAVAWDATQLFDAVAALYEDNCTITLTVTLDHTEYGAGNTDCAWIITYTFKIEDDCDNATYCEVTRSGGDTEKPALRDPLVTSATLNISGVNDCLSNAVAWDASQLFDDVAALYEDNCTVTLTVTLDGTVYGTANTDCAWIITYTFKVADDCGKHVFCEVSRSGGDTGKPVVSNRPTFDLEYSCDRDVPAANENSLDIIENCSAIVSITLTTSTREDGSCPNTYTLTRKWRVQDACGNVTNFDQVINVVDKDAPYLVSPTLTCATLNQTEVKWCWDELIGFNASTLESDVAALYADNCGVVTATWVEAETNYAGSDCGWIATFTFEITDECNNIVICTVVYTGGNSEAPRLVGTIPAGETGMLLCVADVPAGPTEAEIAGLFEVNCGVVTATKTTTLVGDDCAWIVTYTFVASDLCGQEAEPVYVVYSGGDSLAPQMVGTITQTVFADLNLCFGQIPAGPTEAEIAALFADNCGDVNVTKSGEPIGDDCSWIVTYTYTIVDDCKNYADPIVIVYSGGDNEKPEMVGTITQTVFADLNLCFNQIPAGPTEAEIAGLFTDNCGEVNVTKSGTPIGDDCSWIVTYTYTIVDDCENYADPIVIVYSGGDSEEPQMVGTITQTVFADLNLCFSQIPAGPTEAEIAALFTDNCGKVNVTKSGAPIGTDCSWIVTYTYTIVDDCENYATQIVIVYSGGDSEAPKLRPEASIPAGETEMNLCFDQIPAGPSETLIAALFTDNCSKVNVSKSGAPIGTDCSWIVTYTYTITDDCGNPATPIVIVYSGGDSEEPVISGVHCGKTEPVEATVSSGCTFVADTSWDVTVDDNCGPVTLSVKLEGAITLGWTETNTLAGQVFPTGLTTITWRAVDGCGHITTCTFDVLITVGPPTFSTSPLPGPQTVDVDDNDVCTYYLGTTAWDVAVYDPCGVISLTYELSGATEGTGTSLQGVTFNCGVTTVVWTATDGLNVISHTFTVTVRPITLSGYVSYVKPDDPDIMLNNVVVRLLDANGNQVASTTTDGNGYYEFAQADVMGASFLEVHTSRPHGGLTSGDAYAIVVRALNDGDPTLYPPYWTPQLFIDHVADVVAVDQAEVDAGGWVTIDDAFMVYARHTRRINSFPAGDWAFYAPVDETLFDNTNANTARRPYGRTLCKIDIHVRTFGDVRGTYSPSTAKSFVPVQSDQVMRIGKDAEFELPVTLNQPADFNAVSVHLEYDASKIEVLEVVPSVPDMFISIEEGVIRVEWYAIETISMHEGEALITLVARPLQEIRRNDMLFSLDHRTEFIDVRGLVIEGVDLAVSSLETSDDVVSVLDPERGDITLNAFPNPFRNELTLNYSLNAPATVRITLVNMIGAVISELVNHQHEEGTYTHVFNPSLSHIDYGVYFVRMEVKGTDSFSSRYVKLLYVR